MIYDSTGKNRETNKTIDWSITVEEVTQLLQNIAANQTDVQLSFGGVVRAKAVYLDPGPGVSTCPQIDVKFENDTNTSFKLDKPTVIGGEITDVFITTGSEAITLDTIIAGGD
jgi:hypothetical protein